MKIAGIADAGEIDIFGFDLHEKHSAIPNTSKTIDETPVFLLKLHKKRVNFA